jgi:hypothetical protein
MGSNQAQLAEGSGTASVAASYFAPTAALGGKFTATISCRFANCCSSRVSSNSQPFSCLDAQLSARKNPKVSCMHKQNG